MLRNYLAIAIRGLWRHGTYSLANLAGLALGVCCCVLVLLFVRYEWTYDAFHEHAERIYLLRVERPGVPRPYSAVSLQPAVAEAIQDGVAGVEHVVRISSQQLNRRPHQSEVNMGEGRAEKERLRRALEEGRPYLGELRLFVDPAFLQVFSFPLLTGDPATALMNPNGIVLTESAARKYLGDTEAGGRGVGLEFESGAEYDQDLGEYVQQYEVRDVAVSGIAQEGPANTSLKFDVLLPFASLPGNRQHVGSIYLLLRAGVRSADVEAVLADVVRPHLDKRAADLEWTASLQPIEEIYLDQRNDHSVSTRQPYVLVALAALVLVVACVNFTNLSTAHAISRVREIGVRKVVGATRLQLMKQVWGEALLLCALATAVGVGLAEILLPVFRGLVQRPLHIDLLDQALLGCVVALATLVGLVAGAYPAAVMSAFRPTSLLGRQVRLGGRGRFSRVLVVLQFGLAASLVIAVLTMRDQVDYMRTKELGFAGDQLVRVGLPGADAHASLELLRDELAHEPLVQGVAATSLVPGGGYAYSEWEIGGEKVVTHYFRVEPGFLDVLGAELVAGRDFLPGSSADASESVIINQTLARKLGWDDPVGRQLENWNRGSGPAEVSESLVVRSPTVIGVARDYHIGSVQHRIEPAVLHVAPRYPNHRYNDAVVRLRAEDIPGGMEALRRSWRRLWPERTLWYQFVSDGFAERFGEEERWVRIVGHVSGLAVAIAVLGLFALAELAMSRRVKEIGVRKTLGASTSDILGALLREYAVLVVAANAVAWPMAYLAMRGWLGGFAYRIDLGPGVFLGGAGLVLTVAMATVGVRASQASTANPVDALRCE